MTMLKKSIFADFRAKCLQVLNDGLAGSVSRTAALSLSTVAGGWLIENKERKYVNLRSQRNLDNNCPDAVVDSLLDGVRSAGIPLCKRFYTLKKGILQKTQGLEKFRWSDRNAEKEETYLEPHVKRIEGVLPPSVCQHLIDLGEQCKCTCYTFIWIDSLLMLRYMHFDSLCSWLRRPGGEHRQRRARRL